jgi:hypothetical protein
MTEGIDVKGTGVDLRRCSFRVARLSEARLGHYACAESSGVENSGVEMWSGVEISWSEGVKSRLVE